MRVVHFVLDRLDKFYECAEGSEPTWICHNLGLGCSSSVHNELLLICYGSPHFCCSWQFGWWLMAGGCLEGVSSMKQQIQALTNRKTEKKEKVIHSFSVRSLARNTMISEMMIGFKFKELYVWEYDMLINSALNNKQQTTFLKRLQFKASISRK